MSPAREISDMNVVMKLFLGLSVLVVGLSSARADKIFNAGTGTTWDCAKDSDVVINTSNGKYTFKGACKDIAVNGSGLKITIESVTDLDVNGSKNDIQATAADDINVNGNDNVVTWAKGINGKAPDVNTLGTGNKVSGGGATATATATTTAGAPAQANATPLDCTKKKSQAITKSNGVYAVTGACDKVALSGSNNIVTIESTKNLAVSGGNNTVTVTAADKIAATGKNNTVTWSAAITGSAPKTAATGKSNTITQAGATVPSTAAGGNATATTTVAPNGAIDCGKQASHSIATNDGTYTYVGKCELITVDGNNNKVTIESAGGLAINGNKNTISATAVEKLGVVGNENKVTWKKGVTTAKPKLSNVGNGNAISQAK